MLSKLTILGALVYLVDAWPRGGELLMSSCFNLAVIHADERTNQLHAPKPLQPASFVINTEAEAIQPGQPIRVQINGLERNNIIRGFLLEAREGDSIIGSFSLINDPDLLDFGPYGLLMNCSNANDAVSHSGLYYRQSFEFLWTPPSDYTGVVRFVATVADSFDSFWVGIESEDITVRN